MRTGYTVIRVLPELTGKPWCDVTAAFVSGLRPSSVRVTHGFVTSDAKGWRVTVHLDDDDYIERIEQEVDVDLPDGVSHGYDLQRRLEKL